jgi:hypothetical protein
MFTVTSGVMVHPSYGPVKVIEVNVGKQRRNDAALDSAGFGVVEAVPFDISRFEHFFDDSYDSFIVHSYLPELLQEDSMIDVIEVSFDYHLIAIIKVITRL